MKTLICDCNGTMALDGGAVGKALEQVPGASADGLQTTHRLLCRRQAPDFQRAAKSGDELLVACTQESRLFLELAEQTEGAPPLDVRPIRFVNLRETGGWQRAEPRGRADSAARTAGLTPKLAALIAAAQRPDAPPVTAVSYTSEGRCLVIAEDAAVADAAAQRLRDRLTVSVLLTGAIAPGLTPPGGAAPSQSRDWPVHAGQLTTLRGWLGAFDAAWTSGNPIDLDLCTRCNACVAACPEGAISASWQVDLSRCRSHRDCVAVCEAAGAIDFNRTPQDAEGRFDLVLDLREQPAFSQHQPPQGYRHVAGGRDAAALFEAVLHLRELVGTFDKPKFFNYREKLCAHSRNERIGCHACIDVCSAKAIRSDASMKGKVSTTARRRGPEAPAQVGGTGGGIVVEPHLCVGCGACTTVCPSGALSFQYPTPAEQGARLRTLLQAWKAADGFRQPGPPMLLIHSEGAGRRALEALGRAARLPGSVRGVPDRVLPVAVWHTASIGLDLWLSALSWGAAQVAILVTAEEAPDYRTALAEQAGVAQALMSGLGHSGVTVRLIEMQPAAPRASGDGSVETFDLASLSSLDAALREPLPAARAMPLATFAAQADKRATLELAIDHLAAHAPSRPDEVALPAAKAFGGSPFGTLAIDTQACTLCLSCVGACPESALSDNPEKPQLRFIEKNCVQCGLCVSTCPENALALQPRLLLADEGRARKQARVLHEVEPFRCVRCSKPFGTLRVIENMLSKLSAHPAFQGAAAERLKMCADCRVIDLHTNPSELRITDL